MFLTKTPAPSKKILPSGAQIELPVKPQDNLPVQDDTLDANYETAGRWFGLCKRHSVHSIDDFRRTVDGDPVLKAHFANFNWNNARLGRLENSTKAYVDYRKDDTIFRKKTPIVLPAGDQYITDGVLMIRTNCCNTYNPLNELDIDPAAGPSQTPAPMAPLLADTMALPPPETIHTPPPEGTSSMTPSSTAASNNPPIPLPPPVYPPPGYDPPESKPTDNPPTPPKTPIPAAAWILGTGLAVLIGFRKKIKK